MVGERTRTVRAIFAVSLVVAGLLLVSSSPGVRTAPGDDSRLRVDFSASLTIEPNGSVSLPGIFAVSGNTYTLLTNYSGGVEDLRDGSVVVGAGHTINHTMDSAGLLVDMASDVTVSGLSVVGTGNALTVAESSRVELVANHLSTSGLAIWVELDSTSVTASNNTAPSSGGVILSDSADVVLNGNNLTRSTSDGAFVNDVTGLTLADNDFSDAAGPGLDLENVTSADVQGNRFDTAATGDGMVLDSVVQGNLSGNSLDGDSYPVTVENSADLNFSDNAMATGSIEAYAISTSNHIEVENSTAPNPGSAGAYLSQDLDVSLRDVDFAGSGDGVEVLDSSEVLIENSDLSSGANGVYAVASAGLSILGTDLDHANNGLFAVQTSAILVEDSNLSRANYPLNLTDGTSGVTVEGSDLDGGQVGGAYLNGVSNITILDSSVQGSAEYGIAATATLGLSVGSTDFAGTPAHPGPVAVDAVDDNGTSFTNDSFEWTALPLEVADSNGVRIDSSNLSNATGSPAILLSDDQQVGVTGCNFFNDSGAGLSADGVTNLTVSDSDLNDIRNTAVAVDSGTAVVVDGNDFTNDGGNAVFLSSVDEFEASGNVLDNDSYAFFTENGESQAIVDNTALDDQNGGLSAQSITGLVVAGDNFSNDSAADLTALSLTDMLGFTLTGNTLLRDNEALDVAGVSGGTVVGNEFLEDNTSFDFDGPVVALAYHNDFVSDAGWTIQDVPTLAFDDGYPIGGNFWSNYTGTDQFSGPDQNLPGSDGIGDTPLLLSGGYADDYPLMTSWADHAATFTETGLPAGTAWTVVFNGTPYTTTSNSLTVVSSVGVRTPYEYSIPTVLDYRVAPASGSGILGAGLVVIPVVFSIPVYPLTFTESGLPSGTSWSVTVNGTAHTSTGENLTLSLANATYDFAVGPVPGFSVTPANGSVTLRGASASVVLSFVASTYPVTVIENGLPSGTSWGVTVQATPTASTGTSLTLSLSNGSYTYAVDPVAGYTSTPTGGSWTVSGGPITLYVDFARNTTGSPPASSSKASGSSSNLTPYYVAIGALAAVAAAGWLLAARRRRPERPAGATASPPPPPPPSDGT